MLAALCDILEVTPADLIVTTARNTPARKTAAGHGDGERHRPERAAAPPRPAAALPAMTAAKEPAIILITGIQAAGKSTVAQLLAEQLPRPAHVRGDLFRRMIINGRGRHDP